MNRVLNLIALIGFASSLFTRTADPIIPQIAAGLHVEPATAALLSTAYALPYALVQPVLGVLADMFSKARLMLICLAVLALASLVCALSTSFEMLIAARVVAGLASGGTVPIALAFVGDLVPVAGRQLAISRVLFALMTGNLLGAFGAGALADLFDWRAVFIVMAGLGFATLAVRFRGSAASAKRAASSTSAASGRITGPSSRIRWPRFASARSCSKAPSCTACSRIWRNCCIRPARRAPRSPVW